MYVRRQRQWNRVFDLGDQLTKRGNLEPGDVDAEIRSVRKRKRKTS